MLKRRVSGTVWVTKHRKRTIHKSLGYLTDKNYLTMHAKLKTQYNKMYVKIQVFENHNDKTRNNKTTTSQTTNSWNMIHHCLMVYTEKGKRFAKKPEGWFNIRCHLTIVGIPIVDRRRSYDRPISTMGFPILVRFHLLIESGPWCIIKPWYWLCMVNGSLFSTRKIFN